MLGDGLGCYDLDHASDDELRDFLPTVSESIVFVERSMSGNGFHVFIEAPESRGWKRGDLERYTRERFIRVTGDRPLISWEVRDEVRNLPEAAWYV